MKYLFKIGLIFTVCFLLKGFNGNAQNKINSYQYWFDNDNSTSSLTMVSPTEQLQLNEAIPLETITSGLHSFTIRFKDDNGLWSIPTSRYFYYVDVINNNLNAYQYWFDNDYSTNTLVSLTPAEQIHLAETIPIEAINEGLHLFSIRFKDYNGKWSIPVSQYFYRTVGVANNKITAYRYWIDEDITNAKYVSVSNPSQLLNLNEDLDFSGLSNGEYIIHFQFKDSSDKWSVVTSDDFTLNNLTAIENTFMKTITVYPNPTRGIVYFDLGTILNSVESKVFSNNGKIIQHQQHNNEQTFNLNLSNNPDGIYFIQIRSNNKKATFQFIKN